MTRRCLRCGARISAGTYCGACHPYNTAAWRALAAYIGRRDHWTCQRCGQPARGRDGAAGHITPYALGGSTHPDNLRWLCRRCNSEERGADG